MSQADRDDHFVQFVGVQKSFDGVTNVVRDLNLNIARGEFMTLLGPSGSGKTTSLLMLAGFLSLSDGDILINGASVGYIAPQKRNIGVVFQSYALFPHMSIAENIAFPLQARSINKVEITERVKRSLSMIRLEKFADRLPGQMSGGQQQRVALARALVFEPSLVLMDEPLGALDKQLREEMQYEIMHIQKNLGVTVVYVTHDQSEALTMSDRIAVFNNGVIQQLATPKKLYEEPETAFVARFIGENNRLNGHVIERKNKECLVDIGNGRQVVATPIQIDSSGTATTLSIRPERVLFGSAAHNATNKFDVTVKEVVFHGDHLRVSTSFGNQDNFILKMPNSAGLTTPENGSMITIGWETADCRALDTQTDLPNH